MDCLGLGSGPWNDNTREWCLTETEYSEQVVSAGIFEVLEPLSRPDIVDFLKSFGHFVHPAGSDVAEIYIPELETDSEVRQMNFKSLAPQVVLALEICVEAVELDCQYHSAMERPASVRVRGFTSLTRQLRDKKYADPVHEIAQTAQLVSQRDLKKWE